MLRWVRKWFLGRRAAATNQLSVVLYTRTGCHLCTVASDILLEHQRRYRFQLSTVDVDTDQALRARHGECVPVVEVNGKVRFRGRVNPVLLRRLLSREAGGVSRDADYGAGGV